MRKVSMEPGMEWAPFFIGLVLVPSPEERFITYDEKWQGWEKDRKRLTRRLESMSSPPPHIQRRNDNSYIWEGIPVDGFERSSNRHRPAAHGFPQLGDLLIGLATPAVATTFYKLLKVWIEAKAGPEVKLKFGDWQADFKGLSQRQVMKLFQALYDISKYSNESSKDIKKWLNFEKVESKSLTALVKEEGIKAERLEDAKQKSFSKRVGSKKTSSKKITRKKKKSDI